jgi:hypothetical protein
MRNILDMLFGAGIRIGLSSRAIAIVHQAPWGGKNTILLNHGLNLEMAPSGQVTEICMRLVPQVQAHCRAALAGTTYAGLPVYITLSDELTRLFIVTPPQNSARLHDIKAAAAMRFQALYGDVGVDSDSVWRLEADWQAGRPFVACAIPRILVDALCSMAGEHGLYVQAIEPNFAAAWNAARKGIAKGAWFGVVHEDALTLGAMATGSRHLDAVRSLTIPADGHESTWLEEQLKRAALQLDGPAPEQIVLAGNCKRFWSDKHRASAAEPALVVSNIEAVGTVAGQAQIPAGMLLAGKAVRA